MQPGEIIYPQGFFTQLKYLAGQNLSEIELRLGFRSGRLANGAYVVQAEELPKIDQFNLTGYSQVSGDRFKTNGLYDATKLNRMSGNADVEILKAMVLSKWQTSGPDSLVKVIPVIRHSDFETYPPGSGVPQWEVTVALRCHVATFIEPNCRFALH